VWAVRSALTAHCPPAPLYAQVPFRHLEVVQSALVAQGPPPTLFWQAPLLQSSVVQANLSKQGPSAQMEAALWQHAPPQLTPPAQQM
jgi:hypothetical protein